MKNARFFILGLMLGGLLFGGSAACAAGIIAERSTNRMFINGSELELEAYLIDGHNYVQLRDVGKAVGFNVYWDEDNHTVQVQSSMPYTGEKPSEDIPGEIVRMLNELRAECGLQEVTVSEALSSAAQDYAETRPLVHDLDRSVSLRAQYGCEHGVGENLAYGGAGGSATEIFQSWLDSPLHLQTMLNESADSVGVGYYPDPERGSAFCVLFIGDCRLEAGLFGTGHN